MGYGIPAAVAAKLARPDADRRLSNPNLPVRSTARRAAASFNPFSVSQRKGRFSCERVFGFGVSPIPGNRCAGYKFGGSGMAGFSVVAMMRETPDSARFG